MEMAMATPRHRRHTGTCLCGWRCGLDPSEEPVAQLPEGLARPSCHCDQQPDHRALQQRHKQVPVCRRWRGGAIAIAISISCADTSHADTNSADRELCARVGLQCEPMVQGYRLRGMVPPTGASWSVPRAVLQAGLRFAADGKNMVVQHQKQLLVEGKAEGATEAALHMPQGFQQK